MIQAARAFGYPFRSGALRAWAPAMVLVVVLPLGLVPLLGYCVRAIRTSAADPQAPPPSLRPDRRLFTDGLLLLLALAVLALPFVAAAPGTYATIRGSRLLPATGDAFFDALYAGTATAFVILLPWALALLAIGPANTAAFAVTGRPRDLFDPIAAGRRVRAAFAAWNLVTAVVVTTWLIVLAGAAILCVGFIPAAVYAMLVSAHATAVLCPRPAPQRRTEAAPAG